ncbi:S-layer homology domain-containing protein [Flavonifractor sp. An9]|uniref:S-layer homology domain-containing protein n=1 Tax=Flavonifractor sp. An9 TaxID=1965664 RepID=UPI000B383720|nr:S-layer homology domain-containing protein [Flavonifractor sp. An9]OUN06781.1 hypothetical protein B5G40_15835 [Flavonifractor sp. An9]
MRNLKRTLSLALAAVMLMGMMVVGAGAASKDFTDAGEIKNVEAVDVMVALGILEGGDKGDFQPNSILTREQAAKIICYMLLGEESAEKLSTNSAVFNDVAADRWSAPYIGYCVNLGILAGDGNGNFFPEGKLTGAAFAKMLLVALGYDPTIEKYTGNDWVINVASDAIEAGISPKGLVLTDDLSRQDAAQMAFQTLTADMVKYASKGTTVIGSDGMQVIVGNTPAESVKDGSENYTDGDNDGIQQFCEKYFTDLKKVSGETDAFGRPGYTWQYNKEDVTFAADEADYTIVVSKADKDAEYWATEANKKLDIDGATTVKNGFAGDAYEIGDVVEYYVGDNNEVSKIIVTRYTADVITDVDTDVKKDDAEDGVTAYITFDKAGPFNNTDIAGYNADTYVKDAVVALVVGAGDHKNEVIGSYVAESVEGAITAYTTTSYTIGGTKYTMAGVVDDEIAQKVDFKEGSYKLYLDNNGYVIKTEVVEGTSTIGDAFFVVTTWVEKTTAYNEETYTYYAQIVHLDGTVEEIEIATAEGTTERDAVKGYLDGLKGTTVFYTDTKHEVNKDVSVKLSAWDSGDDYKVGAVDFDKADKIKADDKKLKDTYYLTDKTVYVVVEGNGSKLSVTSKTGGVSFTATSNDDAAQVIYSMENGSKVANYVVITTGDFAAAETGDYIYVAADTKGSNVSGGFAYTVYDMEGNEVEIVEKDATKAPAAGFYTYSVDEDDLYTLSDKITDSTVVTDATYTSYLGDLLTSSKFSDYDASKLVIVDTHDTDGDYSKSVTTLAAMQAAAKNGYTVTFDAVVDANDETVTFIVVTDVTAE